MKKTKKIFALLLALTMVFTMNINDASAKTHKTKVKVKSVKVTSVTGSRKVAYVAKGKSVKLSATVSVKPNKKANKAVVYRVANKKIATVSKKGVVKGIKPGITKVTVASKKNSKKKKTITIKVVKNSVKKITLNKKSTVLAPGATDKLKASVKAPKKGSYKAVVWKSSNKNVVTVSKKGVIKGNKEGTAKVTAYAADGSKKKAVCTVTVGNSITKMDIPNGLKSRYCDVVEVSLATPQTLSKTDFTIESKKYENGTYKYQIEVMDIATTDNKNYTLFLFDSISVGDFVKVSVNKLKGIKSAETRLLTDADEKYNLITGSEESEISEYISANNMVGYVTTSIDSGKLPDGIKLDGRKNHLKGKVKSALNNHEVVFKCTDELGRTQKVRTNFLIGNKDTVVVESKTIGINAGDKIYAHQSVEEDLYVRGGSGNYKYELLDNYGGIFYIYESGSSVSIASNSDLKAGTYNIRVKATDEDRNSLSGVGTLKIVVSESFEVKTIVKTPAYVDAGITFYNKKTADLVYCYNREWSSDGKQLTMKTYLPKGDYMVIAEKIGVLNILGNITVNSNKTLNYNIDLNKNINVRVYNKSGKLSQEELIVRFVREDCEEMDYRGESIYLYEGEESYKGIFSGKYVLKLYDEDYNLISTSPVITVNNSSVNYDFHTNLSE